MRGVHKRFKTSGKILFRNIIPCQINRFIVLLGFGKILIAIRDREDRVRFSGYDTAHMKAFVFAVAAVLSSIGGAFYSLQVGLIAPGVIGVVASVEMVIYAAVGGRLPVDTGRRFACLPALGQPLGGSTVQALGIHLDPRGLACFARTWVHFLRFR